MVRDHQSPRAELRLSSGKAGKVAGDLEEDLAGQVLRLAGAPAAQVAEHEWSEVAIQRRPCPLGPGPGGREHLGEALSQTQIDLAFLPARHP